MTLPTIPPRETLQIEFKSDRDALNDDDLIEALICLANAQGGTLYLGVENDGTVTGLHASRPLDITGLAALIATQQRHRQPAYNAGKSTVNDVT